MRLWLPSQLHNRATFQRNHYFEKDSAAFLYSRSDNAHVDTPDEPDEAKEDDAAMYGDEGEANDGSNGPHLEAGNDDRYRFLDVLERLASDK